MLTVLALETCGLAPVDAIIVPDPLGTRELDVELTNIAAVTIDPNRARVGCDADVHVTSDGPATVGLAGCDRTVGVH